MPPNQPPLVYVAGPYTMGDTAQNVRNAIEVAHLLREAGFAVVLPHTMTGNWDAVHPRPWADWIAMDLVILARCDCLLRLPGMSRGADREEMFALQRGIQVYLLDENWRDVEPDGVIEMMQINYEMDGK